MRPRQVEEAMRKFTVVYVPFGLVKWHGKHLPLGDDALKAHGILVKCAEEFGGLDPIIQASAEVGRLNVELAAISKSQSGILAVPPC